MGGRVRRLPFVLLGLMTIASFGGPVAFGFVLGGGARRSWPPDRPIEWWTLGAVSGLVVILMAACIAIGLQNSSPGTRASRPDSRDWVRPERRDGEA